MLRIKTILDGEDQRPREEFSVFLQGLRGNLNDSITESDAIDMLSQHLITKPVFEALFEGYSFAASNPVSQVMDSMVDILEKYNLDSRSPASNPSTGPSASAPRASPTPRASRRSSLSCTRSSSNWPSPHRRIPGHRLHPGGGRGLHHPCRRRRPGQRLRRLHQR
ncbi:hypothetical protein [Paenarthrobacter sp. C1]|uniref:hypothetical protein n=1 Tax=Paenarthrobacter sp. C1 TaxID=3400220 RepID=UPI003BF58630